MTYQRLSPEQRRARRIEDRVRRHMDEHGLWPRDGRLIVAVSGGPDSTALLLVLARLVSRRPLALTAAYFDHGLRGDAATREERAAVERLTASLGLPLITGAADVRELARREKVSLEAAARKARYAFLAAAAREAGCTCVATGHTASDQAETVLMRIVRGTGVKGLAGIASRAGWPFAAGNEDLSVVRPLLGIARKDTLAYCDAAGVTPVEDESNASPLFLRNRVRHELMPLLRELNPGVEGALVRLATAAGQEQTALDALVMPVVETTADGVELQLPRLRELPAAMWPLALKLAIEAAAGDSTEVGAKHIVALTRLVERGRMGDKLDLPGDITARRTRSSLVLSRAPVTVFEALPEGDVCLSIPGDAHFGALILEARVGTSPPHSPSPSMERGRSEMEQPPLNASVNVHAASIRCTLNVRRRRPGDRMQPLGMDGTKKVQDLLVDAHVPREARDSVPIFECERGIVWLGGVRIAGWAQPRDGEPVVTLSYRSQTRSAVICR